VRLINNPLPSFIKGKGIQEIRESLKPQWCCRSTIRSVGYCSGIMSVNERADIDYKGTEQIADSKRGIGKALAHAGSGQDNGSE